MITFIKLGGSLITDKHTPFSAKKPLIKQLGREILQYSSSHPEDLILLGHGSGSFGHETGNKFNTRNGVQTEENWRGFQQVWWAAHQLNQIVCELFVEIGLPVISLPASSSLYSQDRSVLSWNLKPIQSCLQNGLIPLIFGDVIFDESIGGTIFSTEELFSGLSQVIEPNRILLAGIDTGVYRDFPKNTEIITVITPKSLTHQLINLENSAAKDVTGGMAAKVYEMLKMIKKHKHLEIRIFSGLVKGNLQNVLDGDDIGTKISAD